MTSENVSRERSLLTRFAYMPGSLTDEELGALQRTYGGPWLGDHGQQVASEGLPLRGLHQRIAAEQLRRKLATEAVMSEYEEGERVVSVQIGERRFAIIPEYNDWQLYAVLDLNRPTVGYVSALRERHEIDMCLTCHRGDCVHVDAVQLYLSSTGGAHGNE